MKCRAASLGAVFSVQLLDGWPSRPAGAARVLRQRLASRGNAAHAASSLSACSRVQHGVRTPYRLRRPTLPDPRPRQARACRAKLRCPSCPRPHFLPANTTRSAAERKQRSAGVRRNAARLDRKPHSGQRRDERKRDRGQWIRSEPPPISSASARGMNQASAAVLVADAVVALAISRISSV